MTIFEKEAFGADAMAHLRFHVTDGMKPGYAVDARLVDLRVRYDIARPAKVAEPVTPVTPAPLPPTKAEPSGMLALMLISGIAITLLIVVALGSFLLVRRRGTQKTSEHDGRNAEQAAFVCTACGKNLKVKATSAGKKVKCPKCGQTVLVPNKDEAEA